MGRRVLRFEDRDKKVVQISEDDIIKARIVEISRRAKNIIITLDNGKALIFHLKMTGQLIWEERCGGSDFCLRNRQGGGHPDKTWLEKLPNKHTRAIFYFDDGGVLYFNDIRRFGYIKTIPLTLFRPLSVIPVKAGIQIRDKLRRESTDNRVDSHVSSENDKRVLNILDSLGVEPFEKELDVGYLEKTAERFPNRKIKQFLLDQTIIAGIGNIYADEALFDAKILPMRLVKDIKKIEWQTLIDSIRKVLEQGIKFGGSSAENFVDAFGQQGRAHEHLKVYRKTGRPCPNDCGGVVSRIILGGRSTHFCPKCQH